MKNSSLIGSNTRAVGKLERDKAICSTTEIIWSILTFPFTSQEQAGQEWTLPVSSPRLWRQHPRRCLGDGLCACAYLELCPWCVLGWAVELGVLEKSFPHSARAHGGLSHPALLLSLHTPAPHRADMTDPVGNSEPWHSCERGNSATAFTGEIWKGKAAQFISFWRKVSKLICLSGSTKVNGGSVFSHCSVRIFYLKTASCKKVKGFDFIISCADICPGFLLLHTETHIFCPQLPKKRQLEGKRFWKMENMTTAAQYLNDAC